MYLIYRAFGFVLPLAVRLIIGVENLLGMFEWHIVTTFAPYYTFLRPNIKSIFTRISAVNISDIHDFLPDILIIAVTLERIYTCLLRLCFLFNLL